MQKARSEQKVTHFSYIIYFLRDSSWELLTAFQYTSTAADVRYDACHMNCSNLLKQSTYILKSGSHIHKHVASYTLLV
jgi:hypothetical protein